MPVEEPHRELPAASLSARFAAQRRSETKPEIEVRRELHRRGYRYRVQFRVQGLPRRRVDIAFPSLQVAVFIDGCFWHRCPEHCVIPKANREWWLWKFETNTDRDADTDRRLIELGWRVLRIWEHVPAQEAANAVAEALAEVRRVDQTRRTPKDTSSS